MKPRELTSFLWWSLFLSFILVNAYFLYQVPYFSDDVFNISESGRILANFGKEIQANTHLARAPVFILVLFSTLHAFPDSPGVPHLLVFALHVAVILILLWNLTDLRAERLIVPAVFMLSLVTSASNLIWFTSAHATLCLFFSLVSAWTFRLYFFGRQPAFLVAAIVLQVLAVNTLEIGYIALGFHFLFIANEQKIDSLFMWRFTKSITPVVAITILNRILYPLLWSVPMTQNHYAFSFRHALKNLPDLFWWILYPVSQEPSKQIQIVFVCVVVALGLYFCFRRLLVDALVVFASLVFGLIYAGITAYDYIYPRFAYPTGLMLGLLVIRTAIRLKRSRSLRLRNTVAFVSLVTTFACAAHWTTAYLLKTPEIREYVSSFYKQLNVAKDEIPANTLVWIFVFAPEQKLIPVFDNSEYLEWAHSIIGFSRIEKIEDRNIHFLLMKPSDVVSDRIKPVLRGYYGVRFGESCAGRSQMKSTLQLENERVFEFKNQILSSRYLFFECS